MIKKLPQILLLLVTLVGCSQSADTAISSIQTPYTISNVREAVIDGKDVIIGSSYEGAVVCYDYSGNLLWENKLSGFMNHDIYCANIDQDSSDEILAANSDGSIYAIDNNGENLWKFRPTEAVMTSVCVTHKDGTPYVVAGGYDTFFYYLTADGKMVSAVDSRTYSKAQIPTVDDIWGGELSNNVPAATHSVNFLKSIKLEDGSEVIALHGVIHSMARKGELYFFKPLETKPCKILEFGKKGRPFGSMSLDYSNVAKPKILMASSTMIFDSDIDIIDVVDAKVDKSTPAQPLSSGKLDNFGYRVIQPFAVDTTNGFKYLSLVGSRIFLSGSDLTPESTEVLISKFSYNDAVYSTKNNKLLLASAQSGGNNIHVIDLNNPSWREEYQNLQPQGNITTIIESGEAMMEFCDTFQKPEWENTTSPIVYLLSDGPRKGTFVGDVAAEIHSKYPSPIFLNGGGVGKEIPASWRRDTMSSDFYRDKRDPRGGYTFTQDSILKIVSRSFGGDSKGLSMWGGHGNDPYYFSNDTKNKILDFTKEGQKTVLIFPEFESDAPGFEWMLENMLFPLAQKAREKKSNLFIRSKNVFWFGPIYTPEWHRAVSGEFADVFVPSMEETTDKSMELSYAARLGVWASGGADSWGTRGARDNTSYNRLRQHSHQMIPNHFLRMLVYHVSSGAQYLDNFAVDQHYMNMLWQMIAKGVLYVPTRDQLVSINPVRMNIIDPDHYFLVEGNEAKWVNKFTPEREEQNKLVFSHLNGTWPGAPVTEWDFSRYAAGVKDRKLHFLPPYNNGVVLITQPDAATRKYRNPLDENLNPIYKGKMKNFYTDGRNYYSDAKKSKTFAADIYYKEVEKAIEEGAKMMPLTVKGEVAWVAAQTAPKHLRLTVIDGGYVNPSEKEAVIEIGTAKVKKITDLVTGEEVKIDANRAKITVPCAMFSFLDVELEEELK